MIGKRIPDAQKFTYRFNKNGVYGEYHYDNFPAALEKAIQDFHEYIADPQSITADGIPFLDRMEIIDEWEEKYLS